MKDTINFKNAHHARALLANNENNIKLLEKKFGASLVARDNFIKINGTKDALEKLKKFFGELEFLYLSGKEIKQSDFLYSLSSILREEDISLQEIYTDRIKVSSRKGIVVPKTKNQKAYVDAIRKYDIVLGIGPAGTGKTYLAMAMAVSSLLHEEVSRIILTRPAIEAGESLGFLPGNLYEKINPYLRPLYDALYDMLEVERIQKFLDRGVIEVAPLAYMRGRTLNDSFIILDEAQNATIEQMKMFLTRLGFDSKTVITGDITQIDLPHTKTSGLLHARKILGEIEDIKIVSFDQFDVVRHELVQKIIEAYEKQGKKAVKSKQHSN